jgi:hypothetical protein
MILRSARAGPGTSRALAARARETLATLAGALPTRDAIRPAEIILRVCGSIGGWLLFLTHALVIAVLPQADRGSEGLWIGTTALALLNALGILLLGFGLPWRSSLRWLGVVAIPLSAFAIWGLVPFFLATTLAGEPLCPASLGAACSEPRAIDRAWPVLQLAVLAAASLRACQYWRSVEAPSAATAS